ncbi:MAG: HDIG domain-containing protein [Clostridia bacterium]|nr:HDIG domain-containing protein [Clostridia bacterium]
MAKWFVEQLSGLFKGVLKSLNARLIGGGLIFYFVSLIILCISFMPKQLDIREDQPSPRDIFAEQGIVYESEVPTEAAREEAARAVRPSYKLDPDILKELETEVGNIFSQIRWIRSLADGEGTVEEREQVYRLQELGLGVPEETLRSVLKAEAGQIEAAEQSILQLLRNVFSKGVQQSDLGETREQLIEQALATETIPQDLRQLSAAIIEQLKLKPNFFIDTLLTAQERQRARDEVAPVQVRIRQNEKIVGMGDVVTAADIEALQKLGLLRSRSSYTSLIGLALVLLIAFLLLLFFLYQYRRQVLMVQEHFVLLGLLVVIGFGLIRGINAINIGGSAEVVQLVGYLIPLAGVTMLIAVLFDPKLAVFLAAVFAFFSGVISGNNLEYAISAFVSSVTGVYSVSRLSQRTDLAKASLYIILANVITILALGLLLNYNLTMFSVALPMGVFNGVLSSIFTIGSLPFLETTFGITTSLRLLELSNPNQPLLKRLLLEAPGSYHHSILVGNLAEAAADAVRADSLLARVGSYYHDVGKLKRPYFFIENQLTEENPHDKLAPTLSNLIILTHVKDGLELAKEYGLPEVVKDIIAQHHGTTLVSFFYNKAVNLAKSGRDDPVSEDDFRYEGPKPQSKEAAIVMLADSVEAAVRSVQKSNPGRVEGTVRKVIREKLEDGQLEECDLTFKELDIIAQAFVRVLSGFFHSRIEYPENVLKEIERRKKDANLHKQPAG